MKIAIEKIIPNPENPRKEFPIDELRALSDSIRQHGLINAIAVEDAGERYILIDGERRWRAAKMAGIPFIEAAIQPAMNGKGKQQRLIMAMVANLQRQDMTPVDEGNAYSLMMGMGLSMAAIAHSVGVSQQRVTSRLALLKLDEDILNLVNAGLIPVDPRVTGALLSIPDPAARVKMATKIARPGMTIKAIVDACQKYIEAAGSPKGVTAKEMVSFRTRSDWDALKQLGKVPSWELVVRSTGHACDSCALADMASAKVCGSCPLVQALEFMLEK